jgi:hypothetical protein
LPAVGLPMGHTTRFVLVDHRGQIRGYYDGMTRSEVQLMISKLRYLAEEME